MWPFKDKVEAQEVPAAPTIIGNSGSPDYRFHRATQRGARIVAKLERERNKGTPEAALKDFVKELAVCEAQAKLAQIQLSDTGEV